MASDSTAADWARSKSMSRVLSCEGIPGPADPAIGGGGDDTITDFQVAGADLIALTGYGVGFGDLICTQDGSDAVISNFGGGAITLLDFDCTDLDNADFIFG